MGCGTGNVLRALEEACADGQVVGADLFDEGLSVARQRVRCALVQTDVRAFAFDQPFDVVGVFDVIEHLEDDRAVLRDLHRATKPGGGLLVTVPAYPALWSYFDEAAKHCRRYRPRELREKLTEAGFTVEYLSPFMSVLAPLVWLGRKCNSGGERSHSERVGKELEIRPGVNSLLKALLAIARRPGDTAC